MTTPIGYWTSYTPGDGSYLETLQEKYGAMFQRLNKREKLYLVCAIASHLSCTTQATVRDEVFNVAMDICCKLSVADQEGVTEALIHNIRWSPANGTSTVHQ